MRGHVRWRMRPATYFQTVAGEEVRADFSAERTSKTRFVADSAAREVRRLSRRIRRVTGWNVETDWPEDEVRLHCQ